MGKKNVRRRKSWRERHEFSKVDSDLEVDLERLLEAIQAPYFELDRDSGGSRRHKKRFSGNRRSLREEWDENMEYDGWDTTTWND